MHMWLVGIAVIIVDKIIPVTVYNNYVAMLAVLQNLTKALL